ncbi:MAG: amidohydrolase [Deltaproteobacteria bacterium]|nr:amidohydrolase [Deltaproteobacteria bacterium]
MEKLDILIKNGTILTMDPENRILEMGIIGIHGDTISFVGSEENKGLESKQIIDAKGGLVLPGLINGHTHAAMSLFRGLADDLPLMEWLNNYIFPAEKRLDSDFVFAGTLLACAEMILSGTTTFCDMYLFEEEVAKAAKQACMRSLVGEVLYDFESPNYGPAENGLRYTEDLIQTWEGDPLVSIAVEPHTLFTCSPELLSASHELAIKYNVPLIIHVAETMNEVNDIKNKYGRRPIEHLHSLGILGPHLIADHCVHLQEDEIQLMADNQVKVIHNPESNMKLASGIAPIPEMLAKQMTVGLGTDGCASNNNLDLIAEMDTAAKLHKLASMDTTVMDAPTVLRMATIEGARALGLGDMVGSLETGKKADIIIVDTNKPHLTPLYNPISHLVYAARGSDVSHSIINGRLVMEERRLLTLDLYDIMGEVRAKSGRVKKWVKP